ncbi:MAG TPA: proline--tRNA ligase [bacterium]|nr:proline--tRNA ligase [bacterium]HPC77347.1 proline--tRNA ligase [bacterium]
MRMSQLFYYPQKEIPKDVEAISHILMVKSCMVERVASGIYDFLPLGFRVLKKIEDIIRREMLSIGAQEVLLPALHPSELWKITGRWDDYGEELFKLTDRHNRTLCLGPTHEEIITTLVKAKINSYRQLPFMLFQIQTKFRDEPRPRFGIIRCREFIMKDLYSFHADEDSLNDGYYKVYYAYKNIFDAIGANYKIVEAASGPIGGDVSHEFVIIAESGEDEIAYCSSCSYSATTEMADYNPVIVEDNESELPLEKIHTPGLKSVEEVSEYLNIPPSKLIKTIIIKADGRNVALMVRGDSEVNLNKVEKLLNAREISLLEDTEGSLPLGFVGPVGLENIEIIADPEVKGIKNGVVGANIQDYHYKNVNIGRDFIPDRFYPIRKVKDRDLCPRCGKELVVSKGIEAGHIFKLGTKYSEPIGAMFQTPTGELKPVIMGCYGIGVSRLVAASIEQNNDRNGIIWPRNIAPYEIYILPTDWANESIRNFAETLYKKLLERGYEVILDDRDERAGTKFVDADLLGIPLRITIGNKFVKSDIVEIKERKSSEVEEIPSEELILKLKEVL